MVFWQDHMISGIFETLSCLVVIDAEGKLVHLNRRYAGILGVDPYEAVGRPVEEVIPRTRMTAVLSTGKEEIGSVFTMKNGETVVCNRYPIRENGEIVGAFAHTTFTRSNEVKAFVERIAELNNELDQCKDDLKKLQGAKYSLQNIIGRTPAIQQIVRMVEKSAQTKSTVLVTGATGTGKELVAHAIHQESQRKHKPFIRLNCASIAQSLFESELFGYADGAFTGARKGGKPGKFELAEGGSLLLDEISQMPLDMQSKLLRVIQEREIERVGGSRIRDIDVRLICISNVDLGELVRQGEFREDLYYRINVVRIHVPALRERLADIEELCAHFIEKMNRELGLSIAGISQGALDLLKSYEWPGNIRELEHALERAANMVLHGILEEEDFDFIRQRLNRPAQPADARRGDTPTLRSVRAEAEKEAIIGAMVRSGGNKALASQYLGIDRSVLYDKLKEYRINV